MRILPDLSFLTDTYILSQDDHFLRRRVQIESPGVSSRKLRSSIKASAWLVTCSSVPHRVPTIVPCSHSRIYRYQFPPIVPASGSVFSTLTTLNGLSLIDDIVSLPGNRDRDKRTCGTG